MTVPNSQLLADRDRRFDDWGRSIVFRHFALVLDPETSQLTETQVDTPLTAIVSGPESSPAGPSASRQLSQALTVRLKAEELPTGSPDVNSRIIHAEDEYDVTAAALESGGTVIALACRRVA
jgi:hypothetical protein